ncbi:MULTISPECIES: hypothetical protein [Microbacterium]|uniref:DUF2993 domain-containing protein n=2 Tax=Microbacterium TaxID=33882 RepID=A0ABV3LEB2_9MICO|nr:hypothetical protein [Microbacterium profundi]MCE7482903.1 hypothetical protein [Microbacterium profundi]
MTSAWPGDSATVVRWVRSTLRRAAQDAGEVALKGLEDIEVSAALTGQDLDQLTLDATGTKLTIGWNAPPMPTDPVTNTPAPNTPAPEDSPAPDIISREPGMVRSFRFSARPMRIERSPLTIDVQAFDMPIVWLTAAEPAEPGVPESAHSIIPDDDLGELRGTFHASIAKKDLVPLIRSVARPMLSEGGIHLGRLRIEVVQDGADGIRVTAYTGVRWKLLLASARAEARIEVTKDAVITIRDLTLGSRNLLVKAALLFARKHVRTLIGRRIDLNESFTADGTNLRLRDVRVGTGERLSVEGRFSSRTVGTTRT